MKSVCEGIAKSQAANPKSVNLNEVVVASREIGRADFVRNYYGAESGISESAKAVMDGLLEAIPTLDVPSLCEGSMEHH